jgi:hypothetical protein
MEDPITLRGSPSQALHVPEIALHLYHRQTVELTGVRPRTDQHPDLVTGLEETADNRPAHETRSPRHECTHAISSWHP